MSLITLRLDLETVDECVFSENPATVGDHLCLDYIPGSAIRGWLAARLYQSLPSDDAWELFHSGSVTFTDGFPVAEDGNLALPMPFSFHKLKGQDVPTFYNLSQIEVENLPGQAKQQRTGFITAFGRTVEVRKSRTLRTAIEPGTDLALERGLFGYEAIAPNQQFRSFITIPISHSHLEEQVEHLLHDGRLLLGRSKNAEYGAVNCNVAQILEEYPLPDGAEERLYHGEYLIWLCSDLQIPQWHCENEIPLGEVFGLPNAQFVSNKSFCRTIDRVRFNGALATYETEQRMFARGSVFCFKFSDPTPLPAIVSTIPFHQAGTGHELGNGLFLLNPELLSGSNFIPETSTLQSRTQVTTRTTTALSNALSAMLSANKAGDDGLDSWRAMLQHAYFDAQVHFPPVSGVRPGPTPSQWMKVLQAAKIEGDPNTFNFKFDDIDTDKQKDLIVPRWQASFLHDGVMVTFQELLKREIEAGRAKGAEMPVLLARLAKAGAEVVRQIKGAARDE